MDDHPPDTGWRVKCPRGHTRLRQRRDDRYYCRSCQRHYDRRDPHK